MTPEIYRKAGEIFHQLREIPEHEFGPALDACCAANVELRAQVLRLIDADRNAGSGNFLERRAVEDAARLIPRVGPELPAAGTVIGRYRLGARIGAGGTGFVY
jgi:hypothetical protein